MDALPQRYSLACGWPAHNNLIVVHGRNPETLRDLKKRYAVTVEPNLRMAIAQARLLVIAVRPASVGKLLQDISTLNRPLIAISLAAGIPLCKLRAGLPAPVQWVRAMPSPVSRIGRGLTALCFDRGLPSAAKKEVVRLFSRVGSTIEVPESKFDAFTVTYSSSHGYHALAALAVAAQKLGLNGTTALQVAAHAFADGIVAWRDGSESLHELLDEAVTPGGIAAAVTEAMDSAGYQRAIDKGLQAGLKRLGKNAKLR